MTWIPEHCTRQDGPVLDYTRVHTRCGVPIKKIKFISEHLTFGYCNSCGTMYKLTYIEDDE